MSEEQKREYEILARKIAGPGGLRVRKESEEILFGTKEVPKVPEGYQIPLDKPLILLENFLKSREETLVS